MNLMDALMNSICLSLFRFSHMNTLHQDPDTKKSKTLIKLITAKNECEE